MLCFVFVTGLTPCVAQAAAYSLNVIDFIAIFDTDSYTKNDISMPWSYTSPTQKQGSIDTVNISFQGLVSWNEGDRTVFNYKLDTDGTRYKSMRVHMKFTNQNGTSWYRNGTYKDGVITQIEESQPNSTTKVRIELTIDLIEATDNNAKFYWKAESANFTTKSAQSGFWDNVKNALTNILTWLKDIRDKIVDGITEIGNTIVTQFNNLLSNLKKLFDEVTEFLFNILDQIQEFIAKVGNWFSDLYNNIASKIDLVITDIKQWVHDLFVPDPQYIEEYRNRWDQWMQLHLGFLYQSMNIIDRLMTTISNAQVNNTLIVKLPKLQLPDNFGGHVIFEGGTFNLKAELIDKHQQIKWLYLTSQAFITGLAVFWTIYFGYKKIHVLIAERSD